MTYMPTMNTVKVKQAGVLGLVSISGLLTAATLGLWWSWQAKVMAGESTFWVPEAGTLGALIFLDRTIVFSAALSEFVLLLALLLLLAPLRWWIESAFLPAEPATSALQWLVAKIHPAAAPVVDANAIPPQAGQVGQPAMVQPMNGQPQVPQPGVEPPGQPQTAVQPGQQQQQQPQSQPGQQPGQPPQQANAQAQVAQQPGQPQPGQPAQPGQQPPSQPGQEQTSEQTAAQLLAQQSEILVDEEEDALASLADVKDLLSSFEVEETIDPWLAELCATLPDISVRELANSANQMAQAMMTQRSQRPTPQPVRA